MKIHPIPPRVLLPEYYSPTVQNNYVISGHFFCCQPFYNTRAALTFWPNSGLVTWRGVLINIGFAVVIDVTNATIMILVKKLVTNISFCKEFPLLIHDLLSLLFSPQVLINTINDVISRIICWCSNYKQWGKVFTFLMWVPWYKSLFCPEYSFYTAQSLFTKQHNNHKFCLEVALSVPFTSGNVNQISKVSLKHYILFLFMSS